MADKINSARSALKADIAAFRSELEGRMAALRSDMGRLLSLVAELRTTWLSTEEQSAVGEFVCRRTDHTDCATLPRCVQIESVIPKATPPWISVQRV